jgi:hypothetical protein
MGSHYCADELTRVGQPELPAASHGIWDPFPIGRIMI